VSCTPGGQYDDGIDSATLYREMMRIDYSMIDTDRLIAAWAEIDWDRIALELTTQGKRLSENDFRFAGRRATAIFYRAVARNTSGLQPQAAAGLDATGQADDRELASDIRGFLDKHQGMNATPEVFAAHHARIISAEKSKADMPAPDRKPPDKGRGR
jgi:hypothetical protein